MQKQPRKTASMYYTRLYITKFKLEVIRLLSNCTVAASARAISALSESLIIADSGITRIQKIRVIRLTRLIRDSDIFSVLYNSDFFIGETV